MWGHARHTSAAASRCIARWSASTPFGPVRLDTCINALFITFGAPSWYFVRSGACLICSLHHGQLGTNAMCEESHSDDSPSDAERLINSSSSASRARLGSKICLSRSIQRAEAVESSVQLWNHLIYFTELYPCDWLVKAYAPGVRSPDEWYTTATSSITLELV